MNAEANRERGSMALEATLLAPVLVAFFLFLVLVGRQVNVQSQLDGAARDGARAASVARSAGDAQAFGTQAVRDSLDGTDFCQGAPAVRVDTGDFGPGGAVAVTVTCTPSEQGLNFLMGFLNVANGQKTGTATAPVDTYRRTE